MTSKNTNSLETWPITQSAWPILSSKPGNRIAGRAISTFINNGQCHLTTVEVYEDGAIGCWGILDRKSFEEKLTSRWVVPYPVEAEQRISVFNFGTTGFTDATWIQSVETIAKEVDAALAGFGRDGAMGFEPKPHYGNLAWFESRPFRLLAGTGSQQILGESVPILRRTGEAFELTRLTIYADSLWQVGSGDLSPISDLGAAFLDGQFAESAEQKSFVRVPGLGKFRTTGRFGAVAQEDRISEVKDKLATLKGEPSVITTCMTRFMEFEREPSAERKEALRSSYFAVPRQLRRFCGDMNSQDLPIRAALELDRR